MNDERQENLQERYLDWTLFRRILLYLKPYSGLAILAISMLFAVSMLNLAGPYLTKIAIDDHISVGKLEGLDKLALIYLGVLVFTFICQFAQTWLMQSIGQRVMLDLRTRAFAHLHRMSFRYFDQTPIGKLVTRVVNDVEVLNEMLTSGLILVFNDLFTLVGIFCVLWYLDWRLALVVCAVFPFLVMATQYYRVRARDALRKNRAHLTRLNTALEENISGMEALQLFSKEKEFYGKFSSANSDKLREDLRALHYNAVFMPSIDVFSSAAIGLAIWYGGGRFIQEEIQLGVLIAFLQYLQKFFEPIRDLAEKFNIIQTAMTSSERIFELLDTPEEVPNPENPKPIASPKGRVEFDKVWFAYQKDNYVLKDVSFTLEPGESLAIVGATGSGKSTLVNALCRFYDIARGEIRLDGQSIGELDKYELRRQMALVPQDVFLFSGNILDNIRLSNSDKTLDDIQPLTRAVYAHEFIETLPEKYNHDIGEEGKGLSLGQRQLLSFARALAVDPRILILDEATSSVDSETEALLHAAVKEIIRGRTSIIIAHRLTTIKHVDKALVLKDGEIAEYGTRRELLEKKGIFYKLHQIQANTA
ncbi:MAG: ABC transporter ATP-binding protein [Candidatus Nitrohelix vancouverensis]|uniref:Multidrug resistance-like ATP-binding protein MdlA n=1 Tax=Candidatus Nitrohelix vancouverensis TaxID=2705534 RepID=A0A7T0C476_9BACT|nr:MAG: ABC transporter ATP-binding protein [Candidatus Nitrohelix vancouverensis]